MKQAEFIEIIEKMGLVYNLIEETKGVYIYDKGLYELKKNIQESIVICMYLIIGYHNLKIVQILKDMMDYMLGIMV